MTPMPNVSPAAAAITWRGSIRTSIQPSSATDGNCEASQLDRAGSRLPSSEPGCLAVVAEDAGQRRHDLAFRAEGPGAIHEERHEVLIRTRRAHQRTEC